MDSPPDGSVPSAPLTRGTEGDSVVLDDGNIARQAILT